MLEGLCDGYVTGLGSDLFVYSTTELVDISSSFEASLFVACQDGCLQHIPTSSSIK